MGTIVINQTDCKQNVVLQSSLDGITGGFYDASGVWHEIGEGTEIPVIKVLVGKGASGTSIVSDAKRAITEPIPVDTELTEHLVEVYIPQGYMLSVKLYSSPTAVVNSAITVQPQSMVDSTLSFQPWVNTSEGYLMDYPGNKYSYADLSASDGNIAFTYRNGDGSNNVTNVFDGYAVVDGVLYHLVGE